jgi:hypothetical protein
MHLLSFTRIITEEEEKKEKRQRGRRERKVQQNKIK